MGACRHRTVQRSRRSRVERWLQAVGLRPFRCQSCGLRIWRLDRPARLLLAVAGLMTWGLILAVLSRPPSSMQPGANTHLAVPSGPAKQPFASSVAEGFPPNAQQADLVPPNDRSIASPEMNTQNVIQLLDLHAETTGPEQIKLVMIHDAGKLNPQLARLDKPPRLVLDLQGSWTLAKDAVHDLSINTSFARSARFGLHKDKIRLVLDLQSDENLLYKLNSSDHAVEWTVIKTMP